MSDLHRICPIGVNGWKVQGKWLGLFWRDLYVNTGPDYLERIEFATEAEAEKYIWDRLASEAKTREVRQLTQLRRDRTVPRVFP